MMVTPLAVLPTAVAPASSEPIVEAPDGAATTPFLAMLAAAVATPLPEPVVPTVPTAVGAAQPEGSDAEIRDAAMEATPDSLLTTSGEDARESRTDARLTASMHARSPRQAASLHPAPSPSVVTPIDARALSGGAEAASEEAWSSEPEGEVALMPVDAESLESRVATPAALVAQSSPKSASVSVGTAESPTQPAHGDTPRRAIGTSGFAAGAVPSNAAQATAAGVLAAFSTNNVERGLGMMPTANAPSAAGSAPTSMTSMTSMIGMISVISEDGAGSTAAQPADPAQTLGLSGATGIASASGDVTPRTAPPAPEVNTIAAPQAPEPASVRAEPPPHSPPAEQSPVLPRLARFPAGEDAPPDAAPLVRAPWVATPTVLPEAHADASEAGLQPSERAPVRAEPASPSHVTVELDPETAGASRVRVAVRGDVVHATVVTDAGGADAMRPQLGELRQALEGQGFREATVQLRTSGEGGAPPLAASGTDVRGRHDSAAAGEGQTQENHPRGRQRGHDQSTPDQRAPTDPDEEQT